jgi:hypothetical protein
LGLIIQKGIKMREMPFSSFQELKKNLKDRKVVLFGGSEISHKTGRKLDNNYDFIVDNNHSIAPQQIKTTI